jgi:hypothetical protein
VRRRARSKNKKVWAEKPFGHGKHKIKDGGLKSRNIGKATSVFLIEKLKAQRVRARGGGGELPALSPLASEPRSEHK